MADRSVAVSLNAKVQGFVTGMRTAQKATEDFVGKGLDRVANRSAAIDDLSRTAGFLGAGMVAGFGAATKAAIDWETAWAGVTKTMADGADLGAIEEGLRELARTLPATHEEIAAVAEAAGQLGVASDAILPFTETMIALGETTNLSADEAATAIAQLGNVMGTDLKTEVDNLGATLVELGNNGASTERDIILMAQRIAGAGAVIGLSEADVMGYANALSSVGIEVEAGGTAISRVFMDIASATSTGGEDLTAFAEVAGMSATEFAAAFREDPAAAVATFIDGLGGIKAAGGDVFSVLSDLGFADIRVSNALLTMSNSGDLLTESLRLGSEAWEDNTALADEAAKRYETTAAQTQIAWNNIKDAAIEFGAAVLPMVADVADAVSGLAQWFGGLPDPVKTASMAIAGGGGFALLSVAAVGKVVTSLAGLKGSFETLGVPIGKVGGSLAKFGGYAVGVGAVAVGTGALVDALKGYDAAPGAEALAKAIRDISEADFNAVGGQFDNFGTVLGMSVNQADSLTDAFDQMLAPSTTDRISSFFDGIPGVTGYMENLETRVAGLDTTLAGMLKTGEVEAVERFQERLLDAGYSAEEINSLLPETADALVGVKESSDAAAAGQEAMADATADATEEVASQQEQVDELIDSLSTLYGNVLSQRDAERQLEESFKSLTDSVKENGDSFDITTEKGRANQAALDDVASSSWDLIDSMKENGASASELQGTMSTLRDRFINAATAAGYGADEASALADELGLIPENVNTHVTTTGTDSAILAAATLKQVIDGIPRNVNVAFNGSVSGSLYSASSMANSLVRTPGLATGGYVAGPGTGTSDSIPARLSNGEYVIKADAVKQYGRAFFDQVNAQGFASGGFVGSQAASAPGGTTVEYIHKGDIYTTDPQAVARASVARLRDAMSGAGLTGVGGF